MIPDINLLPNIEKKFRWGRWLLVLLLFPVVFIVLFFIWQSVTLSNDIKLLNMEINNQTTENNGLQADLNEIDKPKEIGLPESVQFLESNIYPVSPILIEIQHLLSSNMKLEHYDYNESIVDFSTSANSITDVAGFVEKLTSSPYFIDVKVNKVTDANNNKRRYTNSFTVTVNTSHLQLGGDGR